MIKTEKKIKFTVVGCGYVGLSLSILLARDNVVTILEIDKEKVKKINNKNSPIADPDIESFLKKKKISLKATSNKSVAYKNADFVIVATPTDYDPVTNKFNTASVESVVDDILGHNSESIIVIKSTVPVGFTTYLREKFQTKRILFSPEFLREGKALYDNLYPSRIVIGEKSDDAKLFAKILTRAAKKPKSEIDIILTESSEAEAIKLFSNTYLAMRIAFFNELDTYSESHSLNALNIINGVCSDPRIGNFYNNPSFGYGGYCLPKDTKQLLANYKDIPNNIIQSIVKANSTRKDFIASSVMSRNPKKIGVYRLIMKKGSDNSRESAIFGIIKRLKKTDVEIYLYEPLMKSDIFIDCKVEKNLNKFKENSDVILANRLSSDLNDVADKVYSRDLFGKD